MNDLEITRLCAEAMGLYLLPAYRKGTILYREGYPRLPRHPGAGATGAGSGCLRATAETWELAMEPCRKCGARETKGPVYKRTIANGECLRYWCTRCGYSWSTATLDQKKLPQREEPK